MSDIDLLGLPLHIERTLRHREIDTLERLVCVTEADLLRIPNIGRIRLYTIRDALRAKGLALAPPRNSSHLAQYERLVHYTRLLENAVAAADALVAAVRTDASAIALDSSPIRHAVAVLDSAIRLARTSQAARTRSSHEHSNPPAERFSEERRPNPAFQRTRCARR